MTHINCTPYLPDRLLPRGGQVRQLTHRLASIYRPDSRDGCLGCREDSESPLEPEGAPALATAPAAALSFRQVSGGFGFSCGVTTDERAYCRGRNKVAELATAP